MTFSNARDISVSAFNPRLVFTNYPLGNPAGRPHDRENQREILRTGFRLLETATAAGEIVDMPFRWSENTDWMRLIFSEEQPFLSEEAEAERRARTERNRQAREQAGGNPQERGT